MRKFEPTVGTVFFKNLYGTKKEMEQAGLVNLYLKDTKKQYDEPCIYALYRCNEIEAKYLDKLTEKLADRIIDVYGYDNEYVVQVYRIPTELVSDYLLILEGRYSELSQAYKDAVDKGTKTGNWIYDKKDGRNLALLICDKDPMVKQLIESDEHGYGIELPEGSEVWEKPNMDKETISDKLLLTISKQVEVIDTITLE